MNEEIELGYGYRRLQEGETLLQGDEYYDDIQCYWCPAENYTWGRKIGNTWAPHRRKIDVGEGYRLLPVGEKTIEGDQYQSPNTGKWYLASDKFVSDWGAPYRRKVETITGNYLYGAPAGYSVPQEAAPEGKAMFYVVNETLYLVPETFATEEDARIEAQRRTWEFRIPHLVLRATLRVDVEATVAVVVKLLS